MKCFHWARSPFLQFLLQPMGCCLILRQFLLKTREIYNQNWLFNPQMKTKIIRMPVSMCPVSLPASSSLEEPQNSPTHPSSQCPAVKTPQPHLTFPGELKHQMHDFYLLLFFHRSRSEEPTFFIFNPLQKQEEEKKKSLLPVFCRGNVTIFF